MGERADEVTLPEDPDEQWRKYYAATEDGEPRKNLVRALEFVRADARAALDLGCGSGFDTLAMMRHLPPGELRVTAIDVHPEAIERTRKRMADAGLADQLNAYVCSFEDLDLGDAVYDFIYAGFSLPFCSAARFASLWDDIRAALSPNGGVLAVQLFGDRDEWADKPEHPAEAFQTREEVDAMTAGLERLYFEEVEEDGQTALGTPKHWHVYHMVLRRGDGI